MCIYHVNSKGPTNLHIQLPRFPLPLFQRPHPTHVLHMVGIDRTRLRAKFRRRTTRRLGGDRPQTK